MCNSFFVSAGVGGLESDYCRIEREPLQFQKQQHTLR